MQKYTLLIGIIFLFAQVVFTQTIVGSRHKKIDKDTDKIFDNLVKIRRDLHQFPEIAKNEKRTSKVIEKYLTDLGLKVKTNIGGYGVVGILKGGKKGRRIAWRADMDAIKTDALDKVDFKSKNEGVRHICGHDVHTAIGLGIANVLARQKDNLEGTIYFVFQPAEETFTGAKAMVEDGLFKLIKPDEIYGLHITPSEVGVISTKSEELFAYQKTVKIKFESNNNVEKLKSVVSKVLQGLSRNKTGAKPWELQKMIDREVSISNPNTMFTDYLFFEPKLNVSKSEKHITLKAKLYETDKDKLKTITHRIKKKLLETNYGNFLKSVEYSGGNPTVVNDKKLANSSLKTLTKLYGDKAVVQLYGQTPYFNEDFIYFQQKVPGVIFFLGGSNFKKNLIAMPHTPDFVVDEEAIRFGVKRFSSLLLERSKVVSIDSILKEKYENDEFNGNVLVYKKDKKIYEKSFGYADGSKNQMLNKQHKFNIGSIYKEFPAVAIMQLKEKKLIQVDDKINKYLPNLPKWSEKVSIKHLLQYSSGLPRINFGAYFGKGLYITDAAIMKDIQKVEKLKFEPGRDYLYSNLNPILLTKIVESVTKQKFTDYAEKNLFEPFGMKNTLVKAQFPYKDRTEMAIPFNAEFKEDNFKIKDSSVLFTSTAEDLYKWFKKLDSFKIINKKSVKFLSETAKAGDNIQSPLGNTVWQNKKLVEHTHHGTSANYEGLVRRFKKDRLTIVILTNRKNGNVYEISNKIREIVNSKKG